MKNKFMFLIISFFLLVNSVSCLTKTPVDVTTMSVNDLLDALEKGYLTSEALVNVYLERIEAYDDSFNAINQLNSNAINEAKELDAMRKDGNIKGRLHGIPILVKSNIDVHGLSTNAGTLALNENYPLENSFVVQRLVDEGAIILGSCNMSALAFSASVSYSSFGHVKNVFDTTKTPLGSSGGSAVAVTASFAAAALGTDTNSSVRAPASAAGLVGMRPTYGLVSAQGVVPYDYERDTVGVLSKTVLDNALLLDIISDSDSSYNINSSLEGKKIGVLMQYVKGSSKESGVTGATDSEIYELLKNSIDLMEQAGAEIVYLDSFVKSSNLTIASSTMSGGTFCDYFNDYVKGTEGPIKDFKDLATSGKSVWDLSGYLSSCGQQIKTKSSRDAKKATYEEYVSNYFDEYELDVLLYPTIKNKLPLENKANGNLIPGNSIGSVIGYPAITVPMGKLSDGISYGVEFLGRKLDESTLYDVSAGFEKVNGNKVGTSVLTPALYSVPNEVTELVTKYEKSLSSGSNTEWLNKVRNFFINYNSYDNEVEVALELLNSNDIEEVKDKDTDYVYCSVLALVFLSLLIIVKNIIL